MAHRIYRRLPDPLAAFHEEELRDPLAAIRGMKNGLLIALPIWALLFAAWRWL